MSTQHFLVSEHSAAGAGSPPARWREAFPDGRCWRWEERPIRLGMGDIVWLDVRAPEWRSRVADLASSRPGCAVVVLSGVPDDDEGLAALQAGARGYCHILAVPESMREVAQVVEHGGLWVGAALVQRLVAATRLALQRTAAGGSPPLDLSMLSFREAEVARAVAGGKSNKEVARDLSITERTVKAHLGNVFEKLGVRDRVQLALRLADRRTEA
ncbi:MAG: hypothetical protein RIS35_3279 [Pseudomonadota bacterium]|jgi:DNA-binding NarL/FixJ family response regulator